MHKNVRSKDRGDVGNVDALDGDSIVISTEGARGEYKIPKTEVEAFDSAENKKMGGVFAGQRGELPRRTR